MFGDDNDTVTTSAAPPMSRVQPAATELQPAPSSAAEGPPPALDVVPFCVCLSTAGPSSSSKVQGVVGTVALLASGSQASVWFGWGDLVPAEGAAATPSAAAPYDRQRVVGRGIPPSAGPLVLAMPRIYGAGSGAPSATQLLGGASEEDAVVGHQMATRLSGRTGIPVYVSCSLHSSPPTAAGPAGTGPGPGGDVPGFGGSLSQRAAALAEKEVGKILQAARAGRGEQ